VFIAEDTVVFRREATRSNTVLDTHFGITTADREAGALPDERRLVLSSDFFMVYQSLARPDRRPLGGAQGNGHHRGPPPLY
jgi:transposase